MSEGYVQPSELLGSVVRICGLDPIDPSPEELEANPTARPLDLNGKLGQTVSFDEDKWTFSIVTFDGDVVDVAKQNLQTYNVPSAAEGGFDIAFPATEEAWESFEVSLTEAILEQKYCVVQMSSKPTERQSAQRAVNLSDEEQWSRVMPEFEQQYMGREPDGKKIQWLDASEDAGNGLEIAESMLSAMAIAVGSACSSFGFNAPTRTNGMLHVNCANRDEEDELLSRFKGESNMIGAKGIQYNVTFSQRRKLCMIYFIRGSGGTLTLYPANRSAHDIVLPCNENQLVVFRHDLLDYTYTPLRDQIALQAWILREPQSGELDLVPNVSSLYEEVENLPKAPQYGNSPYNIDCMALATRLPGNVNTPDAYWNVLGTGTDGLIQVPQTRWDIDMYYEPDTGGMPSPGKGYARHMGMLTFEQMSEFDNEFFGISESEAHQLEPPARNLVEVGYDCLYRAGWDRNKLRNVELATVYGYSAGDLAQNVVRGWHGYQKDAMLLFNSGCNASRLHYVFGMTGPSSTIETACSSSLYATALVHASLRPQMDDQRKGACRKQYKQGMAAGSNGYFEPFFTLSLCGAHMLSLTGRCYTFNSTADGYARGEGTPFMYYKLSQGEDLARLAVICGTCMNQDGRSASMTAPNGPSQQECIRHSLREAGISAFDIHIQELHGTGTSLGDPIEVGALRATMMYIGGAVRERPLVKTSSKSNIGHTELSAGICGIMKCVLMGMKCCSAPNCHLKLLNPHIDSSAYPVYFGSEFVDQGGNWGFLGVSSFGFSGCNARGDIWARAMSGPRNVQPGHGALDLTCARIFICKAVFNSPSAPPYDYDNSTDNDGLDSTLLDAYLVDDPFGGDKYTPYCKGSFSGQQLQEMVWQPDASAWACCFVMGDAMVEQFQVVLDKNPNYTVFPVAKMSTDKAGKILGPGIAPPKQKWVIDGSKEDFKAGTILTIMFWYDEATRLKNIWWGRRTDAWAQEMSSAVAPTQHGYHIAGSWNLGAPTPLAESPHTAGLLYRMRGQVTRECLEAFQIVIDQDARQALHPELKLAESGQSPACGPDGKGRTLHWGIFGDPGDTFEITLDMSQEDRRNIVTWIMISKAAPKA